MCSSCDGPRSAPCRYGLTYFPQAVGLSHDPDKPASGTSRNKNHARIHNGTKKFLCGFILEKTVNHRWTYPAVARTRAQADKYGSFKKLNQDTVSPVRRNLRMKNLPNFAVHLCLSVVSTAVFRVIDLIHIDAPASAPGIEKSR